MDTSLSWRWKDKTSQDSVGSHSYPYSGSFRCPLHPPPGPAAPHCLVDASPFPGGGCPAGGLRGGVTLGTTTRCCARRRWSSQRCHGIPPRCATSESSADRPMRCKHRLWLEATTKAIGDHSERQPSETSFRDNPQRQPSIRRPRGLRVERGDRLEEGRPGPGTRCIRSLFI